MQEYNLEYNAASPSSIEEYAKRLINKSFQDIIDEDNAKEGTLRTSEDKRNKGNLGQIIEERFFHYSCNSDSNPDFQEAGVELKVTPFKKNSNGKLAAKERLILTMIDYCTVVNEEFETSHLWNKAKLILLIYYLYTKEAKLNVDYKIKYVKLFTPPEQDLLIIKNDYNIIVEKIRAGKAHELSESDTMYLGAATKSSSSSDRRKQPFSDELAKPRAFSFKNSYMTYVLNNYIVPGKNTYEPIIKGNTVESFEEYVVGQIQKYAGNTEEELRRLFGISMENNSKNIKATIAYRILGIKGNKAEEFEKANIVLKTIRIEKNNTIKQSMSFPAFKFCELIEESWETSTFGNYLDQTRFLFVVYKQNDDDEWILKGCQFWNIPYNDLQVEVKGVWERTVETIKRGVCIEHRNGKQYNNLPGMKDNEVCHVRPHGQNANDTYPLPDGREMAKHCFWLNNTYILSQLDSKFFGK